MILRSILLAAAISGLSVQAPGQGAFRGTTGQIAPSRDALNLDYENRAKALQQEMMVLKQTDGGMLTSAHLTLIQNKLQALLSSYHRDLARLDPLSVNADGSSPH